MDYKNMEYKMHYIKKMAIELDKTVGEEKRREILKECRLLSSKDKKSKRGEAMITVMENMKKILTEEEMIKSREGCACKPKNFDKYLRPIYESDAALHEKFKMIENTEIAGNPVKVDEDTFKVYFYLKKCPCGMVGASDKQIPLEWCHCCKEHVRWLYSKCLKRELRVELEDSFMYSGNPCEFNVKIE